MHPLQAAAELCQLAGKTDLADYLGRPRDASPADLVDALEERRRWLQSMLSNPKFRRQAEFVLRHAGALREACTDLEPHFADMMARAEERHLPAIEMMLRGMFVAGPVSPHRLQELRRGAVELGVRGESFDRVLANLEPTGSSARSPQRRSAAPRPRPRRPDAPQLRRPPLNGAGGSVDALSRERPREAMTDAERQRRAIARRAVAHPSARERYETLLATPSVGGAPPLANGARVIPQLSVTGARVREIPRRRPDELRLVVAGGSGGQASVTCDVPWLVATPASLTLTPGTHTIVISVLRDELPWSARSGTVTVRTPDLVRRVEYRAPHFLYRVVEDVASSVRRASRRLEES